MPRKIPKIFSAISKAFHAAIHPLGTNQPYNGVEMAYLEEAWAGTLAGTVVDKKIDFDFGGGIKPTFELIDTKDKKEEQVQEELKQFEGLLDQLVEIDNRPNIQFNEKAKAIARMAKVFGRGVLAFEPEQGIPEQLKVIHSRDLGRPELVSDTDWSLKSVIAHGETLLADEMIYLENLPDSPVRRARYYGYSEMQRVLGLARALDRIVRYDAPEIAHSMWASYGMVIVNTDGKTTGDATTQLTTIAGGMKPGAFNFISGKPKEDVEYIPMDLEAKVGEIVQLVEMYERMIIGNSAIPGPLLGREEDSNMATLFGKIRLFLAGPIAADREWLSSVFSKQWYERNLKLLPGGKEALEKVRVKAEFEPITIESWVDSVDALVKLKQALPGFPDSGALQLLNLEQYKDELEAENAKREEMAKQIANGDSSQVQNKEEEERDDPRSDEGVEVPDVPEKEPEQG